MKFKGILLKPLAEQHDQDGDFIDPAGVVIDDEDHPLWNNFSYEVPRDLLGHGRVVRLADGGLGFEGEITAPGTYEMFSSSPKLAIGVSAKKFERDERGAIRSCALMGVSLTMTHEDPDQPPIEVLDEDQP